jgi:hypothetical protein
MKCVPKSYAQAAGEVKVTASFLNNFSGDNVRRLAKSFGVSFIARACVFEYKRFVVSHFLFSLAGTG